jgi:hypothetical protein
MACVAVGAVVSGEPPATAQSPYTTPDMYSVGGAPNFTALADEGSIRCRQDAVYNNSRVGPAGDPSERVLASFGESCPGVLEGVRSPELNLKYECGAACVDWLINYGACQATDLRQV